jgi:hypothetical protein
LKRLALLWLTCAAVGFAVAACTAVVIALAFDRGSEWRPRPLAAAPTRHGAPSDSVVPPIAGDTGHRLLGE